MKEINKELIEKLSDIVILKLSDDEIKLILEDKSFYELLEFMERVDTKNVEMMDLPFEEETTYLREDVVNHQVDRERILENAPKHNDEFIEVVQVIEK